MGSQGGVKGVNKWSLKSKSQQTSEQQDSKKKIHYVCGVTEINKEQK